MHQRQLHKKGKLSQERTIQLANFEFNWGTQKQKADDEQWKERFSKLALYKENNDNCNVPQSQGALGNWETININSTRMGS